MSQCGCATAQMATCLSGHEDLVPLDSDVKSGQILGVQYARARRLRRLDTLDTEQ
jgi:hypothetical protein